MVTWISFVLGFIASPISTRLFAPEELAKVGLFSTYASLVSSICYLGLDQAFVRFFNEPPEGMTKKGLFTVCISAAFAFSVVSSIVLVFFWRQMSGEIVGAPDPTVFLCLCVYSFSLVAFRFLSLCYRMEKNVWLYTVQGVVNALLTKIAYLAVGFAAPTGRAALIALTVLTALLSLTFLFIQRSRFDGRALSQVSRPAARELGAFALPLVPLSVLMWLNSSVSTLSLKHLLGYEAAGIFSSALGLASTINIIQTGFNTYWAPYVLENYQTDSRQRFYTVHRLMACMLTLFGLVIALLQAPVFLLLGRSYRSSVVFFPFLFLSPICYCLGETTGMGITISKKTYWTTVIYLFSSLSNIGLCYLLIPPMGMAGAAVASAVSAILTLLLRTAVGEKYYRAISHYRYLAYTIGLMLMASVANLLLSGIWKYAALLFTLALACVLFREEIRTLWTTAAQVLRAGLNRLRRGRPPREGKS